MSNRYQHTIIKTNRTYLYVPNSPTRHVHSLWFNHNPNKVSILKIQRHSKQEIENHPFSPLLALICSKFLPDASQDPLKTINSQVQYLGIYAKIITKILTVPTCIQNLTIFVICSAVLQTLIKRYEFSSQKACHTSEHSHKNNSLCLDLRTSHLHHTCTLRCLFNEMNLQTCALPSYLT